MSALVLITTTVAERPNLPPLVEERIAAFLGAGLTGTIELNVKEGSILAYKIVESGRVPSPLDRNGLVSQDSGS